MDTSLDTYFIRQSKRIEAAKNIFYYQVYVREYLVAALQSNSVDHFCFVVQTYARLAWRFLFEKLDEKNCLVRKYAPFFQKDDVKKITAELFFCIQQPVCAPEVLFYIFDAKNKALLIEDYPRLRASTECRSLC